MYSPKIKEDLISVIFKAGVRKNKPMTRVVDEILRTALKKELTTQDLRVLLAGKKIRCDCGHSCTLGHSLANTLIIVSNGGDKIETLCHGCY